MIAYFKPYGMVFAWVPKCVSTSLLQGYHVLQYGGPYNAQDHDGLGIHAFYTRMAEQDIPVQSPPDFAALRPNWAFTVVRDPVRRLMSAYADKVRLRGRIAENFARPEWQARNAGRFEDLPPDPDPSTFFENLSRYARLVPDIAHHTAPIAQFLGHDLSRFDRVFLLERKWEIAKELSDRFGMPFALGEAQRTRTKLALADLSRRAQQSIIDHTQADYALLGDRYAAPATPLP